MRTIHHGGKGQLNPDGTQLICGYETVKHVDLVTGVETPWPLNGQGEWYPCGWQANAPIVFQPTQASPPQTQAFAWDEPIIQLWPDEQAVGHGDLHVYAGDVLSTNGSRLWHNGRDITPPEPFSGVVWSGPPFYGYAPVDTGKFYIRDMAGALIWQAALGAGQCPYTIHGRAWLSGFDYTLGATTVDSPDTFKSISGEMPGPIFEHAGVVYVVTGIMGSEQNPRGVMVRPWSEFHAGGKGWYLDGIRHQMLQARVRGDGKFVIAGTEFPGSGLITIGEVDPSQPMHVVPPENPPIDPPPSGGDDVTAAEVAAIVKASEERILAEIDSLREHGDVIALNQAAKADRIEELSKAERSTRTAGLRGTILRNDVQP